MSGATDRREDEQVPQFYGRLDEKFAEWETDVRLWQVEFKLEDRDRLGPRLYRRGLHGQPKTTVKTKLATQDVNNSQGQTQLEQFKKATTQTIVAKKREEVRDDLREAGDRARDRPGGYAEAPNFHLHGNSDDDQADTISESESTSSEQWYELDGQEQEALISLRDARKKLQHATKSRLFYRKGGGRARSTGKSM